MLIPHLVWVETRGDTELLQLSLRNFIVADDVADGTAEPETLEELRLVLHSNAGDEVGALEEDVGKHVVMSRELNIGACIPVHFLRPLLLLVGDGIACATTGM